MTDISYFQKGLAGLHRAMHGKPDRVPILTQMHEFSMAAGNYRADQFYSSATLLVDVVLDVQKKFGIDVPMMDYDIYNLEAEALGQSVIFSPDHMPDVDRTRPLIRDEADLAKIRTPDFEKDGRFPMVLEMYQRYGNAIGTDEITGLFCAPFSLVANLMGIDRLLTDLYMRPGFVRNVLERVTEAVLIPWLKCMKRKYPRMVSFYGSDAVASIPIISPKIMREWALPYVERLNEACGPGVYVPNWIGESSLKAPEQVLDLKIRACPEFVQGQDPDVERLGPAYYRKYADKKNMPLVLGIGAAFLCHATPEEVIKRVRHYIEAGGKDGRFALYLCNLGATTPPENVRAVVEAVHRYGTYE